MGVNEKRERASAPYMMHQMSTPVKAMNRRTMSFVNRNFKYTGVKKVAIVIRCKKIAISASR